MELAELSAYADRKYHIREEYKWKSFPGFSVLCSPDTGRWVALLMRQWDSESGTMIERCDLKCGRNVLQNRKAYYLIQPVRMKGTNWIGVVLDSGTDRDVVCALFDRAVGMEKERLLLKVPEVDANGNARRKQDGRSSEPVYRDTVIPGAGDASAGSKNGKSVSDTGMRQKLRKRNESWNGFTSENVPEKILQMRALYEYRGSSFAQKCRNFYIQGRFMENYEDDAPWEGNVKHYFTTYHDLNIPQLRGYFTWRTCVRKGKFQPVSFSFVYIYLYELLCGIGTKSPEDSLQKMKAFETGFLDAGMGSAIMRQNLHRWMFGLTIVKGMPKEEARKYADPAELELDRSLTALKNAEAHSDAEVFAALDSLTEEKLSKTLTVRNDPEKGKCLFAALWRIASNGYRHGEKDLFAICFGEQKVFPYRPLINAVFWEENPAENRDLKLDPVREYICRDGIWKMKRYDKVYFNRDALQALVHEGDRIFRKYMKTGHYLRKKEGEAWVTPFALQAAEEEKQAEIEAARPKITIDFSGLDKIRRDAAVTRDALLTEEETENPSERQESRQNPDAESETAKRTAAEAARQKPAHFLSKLLEGKPVDEYLKTAHLMPSVVTDEINGMLFDEIGDNVLECDGSGITVVEDYREDLEEILKGWIHE